MKNYRFAFDMGTNSIGWAVFEVDTNKTTIIDLLDCGSRIFSDSRDDKKGTSLAIDRREARQIRRRFDRLARRRKKVLQTLIAMGLFPNSQTEANKVAQETLKSENPYDLRVKLLEEKCSLFTLGRAILHLNKRRGFKSSRKDDKKTGGKLAEAISHLQKQIGEGNTLGQFFASRLQNNNTPKKINNSIICRKGKFTIPDTNNGDKEKETEYEFYISRDMIAEELQKIWIKQKEFYPDILTDENYTTISENLLYQRSLLPQEVGKCRFEEGKYRCSQDIPTFELYRLYLTLAHLRILDEAGNKRSLTVAERDSLINHLSHTKDFSFHGIRKFLKLPATLTFSHSELKEGHEEKSKITGCPTLEKLEKALGKERFNTLSLDNKDTIAFLLADAGDQDILIDILTKHSTFPDKELEDLVKDPKYSKILATFSIFNRKYKGTPPISITDISALPTFTQEEAEKLADITLNSTKYASLSLTAIKKILPYLQEAKENIESTDAIHLNTYDRACTMAGYNHSETQKAYDTEEEVDEYGEVISKKKLKKYLPYYGISLPNGVMGEWKQEKTGSQYAQLNNRQRYGFIANPSVHVALNQLRTVVNALIKKYGTPVSIAIELARELPMGPDSKNKYETDMQNNMIINEILKRRIQEIGREYPTKSDLERAKLFEEAQKAFGVATCIYSGKVISFSSIFSRDIEVDHILYRKNSNDDTFSNKILCYAGENQKKAGRNPYQAFGTNEEKWKEISILAKKLPKNKAWRFTKDAEEQYEEMENKRDARDIGDTRYIARATKEYLEAICDKQNIIAVTGKHTNLLAKYWDFFDLLEGYTPSASNSIQSLKKNVKLPSDLKKDEKDDINNTLTERVLKKNRLNHFHHALDATLIGMFDVKMMQDIANQNKACEDLFLKLKDQKLLSNTTKEQKKAIASAIRCYNIQGFSIEDSPLYELDNNLKETIISRIEELHKKLPLQVSIKHDVLKAKVQEIIKKKVISHKIDHNTGGRLHAETVYGKCKHSLRFKDFTLTKLFLIEDKTLLNYILEELFIASGIPTTHIKITELIDTLYGATEKKITTELHKAFHYKKDITETEAYKAFMPIFTQICKTEKAQELLRTAWLSRGDKKIAEKEVIRKIPCIYDENTFLGNVSLRTAVEAFRIEDLPYIKEESLLARILQRLMQYTQADALQYARELQQATTKASTRKSRISEILKDMKDDAFSKSFQDICATLGIRRITCVDNKNQLIWMHNKAKGVDGQNNAYTSVYIDASGKWKGECISAYNANQKGFIPKWKEDEKNIHVIDIFKKDAIEITMENGERGIFIVQKMSKDGVNLAFHTESNASARETELKIIPNDGSRFNKHFIFSAISSLLNKNPLFVHIDPIGNIIYKKNIRYER